MIFAAFPMPPLVLKTRGVKDPFSTTVRDLYCEQPALVCHGPQLPCVCRLRSSGFLHADAALWQ